MSSNILSALQERELTGKFSGKNQTNMNFLPKIRMKIETCIPKSALQAGHIIMGFTSDNLFLLSYTIRPLNQPTTPTRTSQWTTPTTTTTTIIDFDSTNSSSNLYLYKLHYWLFIPHKLSKKPYASTLIFDRNGISDPNLLIQICQLKNSPTSILINGSSNLTQATESISTRCYLTQTTIPPLPKNKCKNCLIMSKLIPCDIHSLSTTIIYETCPPYPTFNPSTQIYYQETTPTVLINTGNMFHTIQINPNNSQNNNLLKCEIFLEYPPLNYYTNLTLKPKQKKFFKRNVIPLQNLNQIKSTIYDLNQTEELIEKNYKTYRKRKLADKKYEFVDESDIQNCKIIKIVSTIQQLPTKILNIKCTTQITRNFIIRNDDTASTTTDIEEDQTDYPVALPLELYTENSQLSMIRNSQLVKNKVTVKQNTLDIELLSNEVANLICSLEHINFLFLIDFDAAIIETTPTGSITALVVILIQGNSIRPAQDQQQTFSKCDNNWSISRQKYEGSYTLTWSPLTSTCRILYKSKLKEIITLESIVWNPTKQFQGLFKKHRLYNNDHNVTHLTNHQMVDEWISVDELTMNFEPIVTLYSHSLLKSNSSDDDSE